MGFKMEDAQIPFFGTWDDGIERGTPFHQEDYDFEEDFEDDYLLIEFDELEAHQLCRYGCGHEADESFGVCDCESCLQIFITDYPEAMIGR